MSTAKLWDWSVNPVVGCSRVSPGCANCYAEKLAATRLRHLPQYAEALNEHNGWNGAPVYVPDALLGLTSRKSGLCFVGNMGDVFHERLFDDHRSAVLQAIRCAALPSRAFALCTKRPAVAREAMSVAAALYPLDGFWLGVTVEDQQRHDERVPILRETPAALRFLSVEPLLGPVKLDLRGIGWVVVGGESGPGARPCHWEWVTSVVRQCKDAAVPVWVKQLGANQRHRFGECHPFPRQRAGSDMAEWPIDLRIRERPSAAAGRSGIGG